MMFTFKVPPKFTSKIYKNTKMPVSLPIPTTAEEALDALPLLINIFGPYIFTFLTKIRPHCKNFTVSNFYSKYYYCCISNSYDLPGHAPPPSSLEGGGGGLKISKKSLLQGGGQKLLFWWWWGRSRNFEVKIKTA